MFLLTFILLQYILPETIIIDSDTEEDEPVAERSSKRRRTGRGEGATLLAGLWLRYNLDDSNRGYRLIFCRRTYPEESGVTILLGPEQEPRKTLPMKLLYDNFEFFKGEFDATPSVGPSTWRIEVPNVLPSSFDLAIQFVVCSNLTVESPRSLDIDSHKNAISALLELKSDTIKLGLDERKLHHLDALIVEKVRAFLIEKRHSLKGYHIEKAYSLKDNYSICNLFVKAAVRPCLEPSEYLAHEDMDGHSTDSDNVARRSSAGSYSGFPFRRQKNHISAFENDLAMEVLQTVETNERPLLRNGRRSATKVIWIDPLTEEAFEL